MDKNRANVVVASQHPVTSTIGFSKYLPTYYDKRIHKHDLSLHFPVACF